MEINPSNLALYLTILFMLLLSQIGSKKQYSQEVVEEGVTNKSLFEFAYCQSIIM